MENPAWLSRVKFGLSEKHTKFEKIFLMVLTNQLKHQNHEEDFFKLCVLLKKSELYKKTIFVSFPIATFSREITGPFRKIKNQ